MAGNKFATMLQRNTNKMVVILVYAVLEWLLILLLLLNSFFSYLITRFATFFGLQKPCLLCSRIDHVLQPEKKSSKNLDKDLVCESHAEEISKLGYCSNHQRLAETQNMCEDCLVSRPNHHEHYYSFGMRHRIGFISWVSQEKNDVDENTKHKCSCCNQSLRRNPYPPYLLLKPSWGDDGNFTSKGSFIVESIDDEKEGCDDKGLGFERNNEEEEDHQILSDIESFILREVAEDLSSSVSNLHSDEKDIAEKDENHDDLNITEMDPSGGSVDFFRRFGNDSTINNNVSLLGDRSIEVINVHFENDTALDRLIPVEFIDSITFMHFESCQKDEDLVEMEHEIETSAVEAESSVLEGEALVLMDKNEEKTSSIGEIESFLEDSIVLEIEEVKKDSEVKVHPERVIGTEEADAMLNDDNTVKAGSEEQDSTQVDLPQSQELLCSYESMKEDESSTDEASSTSDDDTEVQNAFDAFLVQNNLSKSRSLTNVDNKIEVDMEEPEDSPIDNLLASEEQDSCQYIAEEQSSESEDDTAVSNAFDEFISQNNLCQDKRGANHADKNNEETNHESSKCSESEEEKLPETPNSADGLHYRKMMVFDKRESGAEDSVDGSVASELEYGCDPTSTIERLKTALKSERKALSAIYQELEEERSASAIAANQTMAMITRLQEEKAAMQMDALQYQRMMEEQAEYDQEALQLLNELMLKREKEKRELEKELEEYRQKVLDYEARENLRLLRRRMKESRDSSPSPSPSSCTNVQDTEARDGDDDNDDNNNTNNNETSDDAVTNLEDIALDCVKHISELDDSLVEFEQERASILDQLRELEEKIISLEENEELIDENCDFSSPEENLHSANNDFSDDNKHGPRRTMGSLAKRLLPYLDAAENDTTQEAYTFESEPVDDNAQLRDSVEVDSAAKVSIEEEVDRVYERLQALETDREFLQHCMGSIQNGDKGVNLLQEILQHLRDLKDVELRLKNLDSDPFV